MTALNYVAIATSLISIAIALDVIRRPHTVPAWQPRTLRIFGTSTVLMATLTIFLTFKHSN